MKGEPGVAGERRLVGTYSWVKCTKTLMDIHSVGCTLFPLACVLHCNTSHCIGP